MLRHLWVVWCVSSSIAFADPICSESFNYPSGTQLPGQTGGAGWAGAWATGTNTNYSVGAALTAPAGLLTAGGSLNVTALDARCLRQIDTSVGSPAANAG